MAGSSDNSYGRAPEDVPVPAGFTYAAGFSLRKPARGEWYISPWDGLALKSRGEPGAGLDQRRIIIKQICPSGSATRGSQPFTVFRDMVSNR